MRTNYVFISLVAFLATLLIASCSELQTDGDTATDGTRTFTFNLTTDEQAQTRAAAPAVDGYKLLYFLQVLDESGNVLEDYTTPVSNESGFTIHLPLGSAYTCLFWAHYVASTGGTANEFFNTDNLQAVTLKKHLTGEGSCQAFCATAAIRADLVAGTTTTVTLHRAVAQVNIKNTESMDGKGYTRLTASYTDVPNTFNVLDNTVGTAAAVGTAPSMFEATDFSAAADASGMYTYQSVYVLASADGVGSLLGVAINTYNSVSTTVPIQTMSIANVPTKKNYKTNVLLTLDPANKVHTYACGFEEWDAEEDFETNGWDGVIPDADATYAFGGGNGEEATPYIIAKPVHLAYLAANVNAGPDNNGAFYEGKYFKLTQNINLGNQPWNPIGGVNKGYNNSANRQFMGHFDGNHKQIKNLKIEKDDLEEVGLFGCIKEGSLKNLHVVNADVTSTQTGWSAVTGGICGNLTYASFNPEVEISGCSFKGKVTCLGNYAGGICGYSKGGIIASKTTTTSMIQGKTAGGIVGYIECGAVYGCYNEGSVSASKYGAGICGYITDLGAALYGCYNTGTVTANGEGVKLAAIAVEAGDSNTADYILGVCYVLRSYDQTPRKPECEKIFGSEAGNWPVGTDVTSTWYLAVDADGSFSVDHTYPEASVFTCQLWKSLGAWNGDASTYPKLWWE